MASINLKILGEALKMCMHHKAFGTQFDFEQCQEALELYQFNVIPKEMAFRATNIKK